MLKLFIRQRGYNYNVFSIDLFFDYGVLGFSSF